MALSTADIRRSLDLFVAEEPAAPYPRWPAVYIDTSVVSYLTARLSRSMLIARRQRITRVWWNRYRCNHELLVSARVLEEAAAGDAAASDARLDALLEIDSLPLDAVSERLSEKLIGAGLLPEKARWDAEHIAMAATNSVPILLTWNFKHLANPIVRHRVVQMCEIDGFRCPEICTPEQLMRTYAHARSHP
jgi:hypothetical protein